MGTTTMATRGVNSDMTATNNSTWYEAVVADIMQETPHAKTIALRLPHPLDHLAGQHYEIRLNAADGYQAARLYSAASVPQSHNILEVTVVDMPGGEVSPYLTEHLHTGDRVEVRGPLGRFFVWQPNDPRPVLLVAGGSGVAPMRAILQAHDRVAATTPIHLLYSTRTAEDIMYKDEFLPDPRVTITITGPPPADWQGNSGRINQLMVATALHKVGGKPVCYVCGMNTFVEAAIALLLENGVPPALIKAERFGA